MQDPIDFSYLENMAEGNEAFFKQVLVIFMENAPKDLKQLKRLILDQAEYDAIKKQAHGLKSSFGIVRVKDVLPCLQQIEDLAATEGDRDKIEELLRQIIDNYNQAKSIIRALIADAS